MGKYVRLNVRMPKETALRLEQAARERGISQSAYVRSLLDVPCALPARDNTVAHLSSPSSKAIRKR